MPLLSFAIGDYTYIHEQLVASYEYAVSKMYWFYCFCHRTKEISYKKFGLLLRLDAILVILSKFFLKIIILVIF